VTRVAVIGLGAMGSRIARRLAEHGHDVVGWNRTPRDAGVALAATAQEAAAHGDVVITMLAGPDALEAVTDDVLAGLRGTLVEMSTVGPAAIARLAERTANLVDAPVLGSIGEAESGTLTIFAGGDVAPVRTVLEQLGTVLEVGPVGSGARAKLVANAALFGVLAALGDAVALGRTLGMNEERLFDVLAATPLAAQAERRRAVLQGEPSPPRFPVRLAAKDARLILEHGDFGVIEAALRALEAADADADYTALLNEPSRAAAAPRSSS
jgi:3-hydroxyisobutyrate dehydrogenase-like beta-hydroxyacid dehydrogenase